MKTDRLSFIKLSHVDELVFESQRLLEILLDGLQGIQRPFFICLMVGIDIRTRGTDAAMGQVSLCFQIVGDVKNSLLDDLSFCGLGVLSTQIFENVILFVKPHRNNQ